MENKKDELVEAIVEGLQEKKGRDIVVADLSGIPAMDYADAIVHIFLPELRAFYDIEHLWADADLRSIPNLD